MPPCRPTSRFLYRCLLLSGVILPGTMPLHGDFTISADSRLNSFDLKDVQPGETVWIEAQSKAAITITNLAGTPEAPILVTNTGGPVILNNPSGNGALKFRNSQHFILRGSSDGEEGYGIRILGTNLGSGLELSAGTTDFEISHIEIANTSFAGIIAKSDELHRPEWTMRNVHIHHCHIHDVGGEGMYIGSSFYHVEEQMAHEIHGVEIHHNLVENAGWDGIQVGCATQDVRIHNNTIRGYGEGTTDVQQNEGFRLNPGTAGRIFNNYIEGDEDSGSGIFANPHDDMHLYNNVIVTPQEVGILIGDDAAMLDGTQVFITNNTIVGSVADGIQYRSLASVDNVVANNLVVAPGGQFLNRRYNGVKVTEMTNLYVSAVEQAGFADAGGGDFRLLETSEAVNAGSDVTDFGYNQDILGVSRSEGGAPDIGAYEYTGNSGESWALWSPILEGGWVFTEEFLAWINVAAEPWIFLVAINNWAYIPEEGVQEPGGWAFILQ